MRTAIAFLQVVARAATAPLAARLFYDGGALTFSGAPITFQTP